MAMKRVLLAEATAAQMREFARDVLGLPDIKDTANKLTLTAQIQTAWDKDFISVSEVVDDTMAARRTARQAIAEETPENHPETVTVNIQITDEIGGDRPVELGVNGKNILVERGKDQEIAWKYYIALQNAVQFFYDPMPVNETSHGGISPNARKVLRYPFQRVA